MSHQFKKKKEKKEKERIRYFFWFHTCQAPPNPTTHLTITLSFHSFGQLTPSLLFSFFFFFFIFGRTLSSLLQTLHQHFHTTTIIFPARSLENSWEPINTFTSFFFEVKISHLFGGFCTFAWGYFYLSFNNDTHVIYEYWKWYLCVFMYGFWY